MSESVPSRDVTLALLALNPDLEIAFTPDEADALERALSSYRPPPPPSPIVKR